MLGSESRKWTVVASATITANIYSEHSSVACTVLNILYLPSLIQDSPIEESYCFHFTVKEKKTQRD